MTGAKVEETKAMCRICYEVCEEKNSMNMGCSCKGDVGYIHEKCAIKWFRMKGNNRCDVCHKEVSNLTIRSLPRLAPPVLMTPPLRPALSWWKVFPILLVMNTLCYFAFQMTLLNFNSKWEAKTLIIVAPSSLAMAIVASFLALFLGKENSYIYAVSEFTFVALLYALFYRTIHLKLIYITMLSSVLGFGLVMIINFVCYRYIARVQLFGNSQEFYVA